MPKLVRRKHPIIRDGVLMPDYISDMLTDDDDVMQWWSLSTLVPAFDNEESYEAGFTLACNLSERNAMHPVFWILNAKETYLTHKRHKQLPDYDPDYYPVVA